MNLLIVSQYFYPEQFLVNELAYDLRQAGHKVTVLTGMPNYPSGAFVEGYRFPWPRLEQIEGVAVVRVPIVPRRSGSGLWLALNFVSYALSASILGPFLVRGPIDAILVFEPSPVTVGVPAIVMKWLKRAPILF